MVRFLAHKRAIPKFSQEKKSVGNIRFRDRQSDQTPVQTRNGSVEPLGTVPLRRQIGRRDSFQSSIGCGFVVYLHRIGRLAES